MIRAQGADYSVWDDEVSTPQHVNFQQEISVGGAFTFIKASQLSVDQDFIISWHLAKQAGVLRGAYHFLDWRSDWLSQATMLCNLLAGDPGELPPVVDFEMHTTVSVPSDANGRLWNFLQYVEKATGKIPMIYAGYYYWVQYGTPNIGWLKYPLWLPYYEPENVIQVPPPWKTWTFWQYTDRGDGLAWGSEAKMVDLNWYNGTVDDLRKFATGSLPIPAPQPTPSIPAYITKYPMNVRSAASQTATIIQPVIPAGTTIYIKSYVANGYSYFEPIANYPKGGYLYSSYLSKV